VIVRYSDDFVMGFENKDDAQEMLLALKERLGSFGLALHEGKTRLIEFGRFAALTRRRRGERKPETLAFLGFIHYCGVTRDGRFMVKHKTEGKRLTRKLKALREGAWRHMHMALATQLAAVLRGHYGYYGRPHNYPALNGFYQQTRRIWFRCLRRRSQKSRRMSWLEFEILTARFALPVPRITRTWAQARR
jgi:RNA-directed DNA polymerase